MNVTEVEYKLTLTRIPPHTVGVLCSAACRGVTSSGRRRPTSLTLTVSPPLQDSPQRTLAIRDLEHVVGGDVEELGLRIDEPPNQPRAGDAVGLRPLTRHPLHEPNSARFPTVVPQRERFRLDLEDDQRFARSSGVRPHAERNSLKETPVQERLHPSYPRWV